MMNEKARELGCKDTWFITPNGLDAQETDEKGEIHTHSTTAKDLARILLYCIQESPKKEEFLKITRTHMSIWIDSTIFWKIKGRSSAAITMLFWI